MASRRNFLIRGIGLLGSLAVISCDRVGAEDAPVKAGDAGARGAATGKGAGAGSQEAATVKVSVFNRSGQLVKVESPRVVKTDDEWRKQLTTEQYKIARGKGTERAFCGNLLDNHQEGVYSCVCCGLPLFSSSSKFNSGTGWPSFFQPVAEGNVLEQPDHGYGMDRTEILCARCDGHLGHVFDDGPRPTGLRFCVNSESLKFTPNDKLAALADPLADKAPATASPTTRPAGA